MSRYLICTDYKRIFGFDAEVEPANADGNWEKNDGKWLVRCFENGVEIESRDDEAWMVFDTEAEAIQWAEDAKKYSEILEKKIAVSHDFIKNPTENDEYLDGVREDYRHTFEKTVLDG